MANRKKNPTSGTAVKAVKPAQSVKEKAAEPEKKTVKPTAEKKAAAPKKATATKAPAKTSTVKKAAATTTAKTDTAKKSTVGKPVKKAAPKTEKKAAAAPVNNKKVTAKRTAKSKADEVVIQSGEKDYALSEITQLCKDAYRGGTKKQIKSIKVYVKAEKNKLKAYYVVNGSVNGSVNL